MSLRSPAVPRVPLSQRRRPLRGLGVVLAGLLAGDVAGALALGSPPAGRPAAGGSASRPLGSRTRAARGPAEESTAASPAPTPYRVTGTVSSLSAGGATGPAIPTPMLITVPVRGAGSAYFYDVSVSGPPGNTVYWNSGEPLGLIGRGGLELGRADVTVNPSGATWYLDGAPRRVEPGYYEAAAPVAVGTSGLATPVPDAQFSAGPTSVLVTSGGAAIHRPPGPLHLVGPGPLQVTGNLTIASPSGTRAAAELSMADGSYVVDLAPGPEGLSLHATVSGKITLGG